MDRLDAMTAFVTAVERGSLAASARHLRHSPASVTRAIAAIEERVGGKLLHRTTRSLRLTPIGETYYELCRQLLADMARLEGCAAGDQDDPRGLLTVTAPLLFGRLHVRPLLDTFLNKNAAAQARLLLLDRVVNLVDEGVDIAVRLAHLPDSDLVASRLGEVRRVLCASPEYLERHGVPTTPRALMDHDCILSNGAGESWSFMRHPGDHGSGAKTIAIRPRLTVNAAAPAIDSALEGCGIALVMSYQVAEHVAAGRLQLLLTPYEAPPIPVHFVMHSTRARSAKVRSFLDIAAPRLRKDLAEASELTGSIRSQNI